MEIFPSTRCRRRFHITIFLHQNKAKKKLYQMKKDWLADEMRMVRTSIRGHEQQNVPFSRIMMHSV